MKNIKKIIATFLCFFLVSVFAFTAAAATTPNISLSNVKAMPGEAVTIDIKISNNPGIMAMSFCITYDKTAFEYTGYNKGYLSKYTIKDHADKGQVAFVNDEAGDKANDGTILSVKFNVKDNAAPGKHTITIANQNREKHGNRLHNSFSNSNLKYIVPTVTAGSITVGETCENAGHKYGEWQIISPADCTNTGSKTHSCIRCNNHTETVEIPITHDFEDEWTVDKAATPTEDGIMSRHCKLCNAVTDTFTFTYEEVEDSQNPDDTSSEENASSDNVSSDSASSDDNSNDETSSEEENSQTDTTASSGSSSGNSSSNKPPINNTVGSKNPQSAVENVKDFIENVKPNLENSNTSSTEESTDVENETSSNNSSTPADTGTDNQINANTDNDNTDTEKSGLSTTKIFTIIIGAVLSVAIIVLAIILIARRKKAE